MMVRWMCGMSLNDRKRPRSVVCIFTVLINNNNNNDNLNTPGSRTVSSCEQYGTNLRRGLARDLGKWLTEIVSFKPALESLE